MFESKSNQHAIHDDDDDDDEILNTSFCVNIAATAALLRQNYCAAYLVGRGVFPCVCVYKSHLKPNPFKPATRNNIMHARRMLAHVSAAPVRVRAASSGEMQ